MAAISHLRSLQALELAMRLGSLTAVAKELSITPAAVGQRIRALEDYLGVDLLVRGRSGIIPTHALRQALPHLQTAFGELETASSALNFQRVGEIQIVADTDFAELWLKQRLPFFKIENPNARFCINGIGDGPYKIGQDDCNLRFGAFAADDCSDDLFSDFTAPITSKEIIGRMAKAKSVVRLDNIALLHMEKPSLDSGRLDWPTWVEHFGHRKESAARGTRYVKLVNALELVNSNVGVLLSGIVLLLDDLERKRLICPFPLRKGAWTAHSYNVTYRESSLRKPVVQRFREWLKAEAKQTNIKLNKLITKKRGDHLPRTD